MECLSQNRQNESRIIQSESAVYMMMKHHKPVQKESVQLAEFSVLRWFTKPGEERIPFKHRLQ